MQTTSEGVDSAYGGGTATIDVSLSLLSDKVGKYGVALDTLDVKFEYSK